MSRSGRPLHEQQRGWIFSAVRRRILESHLSERSKLRAAGRPSPPEFGWKGVQTEANASEGVLFKSDESRAAYFSGLVFSISVEQDLLIQRTNMLGQQYRTPLHTTMAGCNQGALILRNLTLTSGGDFAPIFVLYGELEARKLPNGDLQIIQRRRQRTMSAASGLLGAPRESPAVVSVYPLLR